MSAADRRQLLLRSLRDRHGPWTTGMVWRLYKAHGFAPLRKTARDDLAYLAQQGVLTARGPVNDRHYTLNNWTGATS